MGLSSSGFECLRAGRINISGTDDEPLLSFSSIHGHADALMFQEHGEKRNRNSTAYVFLDAAYIPDKQGAEGNADRRVLK